MSLQRFWNWGGQTFTVRKVVASGTVACAFGCTRGKHCPCFRVPMAANQQVIFESSLWGCQTTVCYEEENRAEGWRGKNYRKSERNLLSLLDKQRREEKSKGILTWIIWKLNLASVDSCGWCAMWMMAVLWSEFKIQILHLLSLEAAGQHLKNWGPLEKKRWIIRKLIF